MTLLTMSAWASILGLPLAIFYNWWNHRSMAKYAKQNFVRHVHGAVNALEGIKEGFNNSKDKQTYEALKVIQGTLTETLNDLRSTFKIKST